MNLHTGIFLKSTTAKGDYFAGAILFIVEYNGEGALGFIINRRFGRALNELKEFSMGKSFPLYEGGPVDNEHLFFIHKHAEEIKGGVLVKAGVYFGGNFKRAVQLINNCLINTNVLKIFIGYCGWEKGQLELELMNGDWKIVENYGQNPFAE